MNERRAASGERRAASGDRPKPTTAYDNNNRTTADPPAPPATWSSWRDWQAPSERLNYLDDVVRRVEAVEVALEREVGDAAERGEGPLELAAPLPSKQKIVLRLRELTSRLPSSPTLTDETWW